MIVYSQKPEEQYYEAAAGKPAAVLLLGELNEQWTTHVLEFLKKHQVPVFFFPWSKIPELRVQLNLTRYPVTQLWVNDELAKEIYGFHEEELESFVKQFFNKARVRNGS